MPSPKPPPKLYTITEPRFTTTNPTSTDYDNFRNKGDIAIVIDNGSHGFPSDFPNCVSITDSESLLGSYQIRAGWSTESTPRLSLPPVVSKYRDRKLNRTFTLAGHDAYADATSRGAAKLAFDADVVSNFDVMENLLDFCFLRLGIDDSGGIGHPVVMTETLCNPTYNRKSIGV